MFILGSIAYNKDSFSTQNEITSFIINSLDNPIAKILSTLNLLKNVGIISKSK